MGNFDRIFRTAVVALIAVLYYMNIISGTLAIVLGILAAVFLLTSLVSICPLYMLFGLSTRKSTE